MRVPLVFAHKAGEAARGPYPEIGQDCKVILTEQERKSAETFRVNTVECRDFLPNKTDIVFWMKVPVRNSWNITLTDSRIIFENQYSGGALGKAKITAGNCTAGQLAFESISHLSAFYDNSGTPLLLCNCYRMDGTRSAVVMLTDNTYELKKILIGLQKRLVDYLHATGKRVTETEVSTQVMADLSRKWKNLAEHAWESRQSNYTTEVPNRAVTKVPNMREEFSPQMYPADTEQAELQEIVPAKIVCRSCGKELQPEDCFCDRCGTKVQREDSSEQSSQEQQVNTMPAEQQIEKQPETVQPEKGFEKGIPEFKAIVLQKIGDSSKPYAYAGTDENGNLIEDPLDHGLNHRVTAKRIDFYRKRPSDEKYLLTASLKDIEVEMTVTDCRVIYRCDDYDKGDGKWSGGLTAVALNAYEKSKGRKRSAGKTLLGHIRYEWIREILYTEYRSQRLLESDLYELGLIYMDKQKNLYIVEVSFGRGMETSFLANEILHKTCRYRLNMQDEKDETEQAFLSKYLTGSISQNSDPKDYSSIRIPASYYGSYGSANRPVQ